MCTKYSVKNGYGFFNQEKHRESDKEDEERHCSSKGYSVGLNRGPQCEQYYSHTMQYSKLFVGFFIREQFEIEGK